MRNEFFKQKQYTKSHMDLDRTDKRFLRRIGKRIEALPIAVLVIILSVSIAVSALALRANNQRMVTLRQAVFTADEQGTDVEAPLRALREYVYSHMNTDLKVGDNSVYPPIQLKYTYERLVQKQLEANGGDVYAQAQAHCEAQDPNSYYGRSRVPCIQDYVASHGGVKVAPVPDSLYKFDFASPTWTPDLAGWSLVAASIALVVLVIRLVVPFVLRLLRVL